MLSSGAAEVLEVYFHRASIMKPGARIKHNWLDRNRKNVKEKLSNQVTGNLEKLEILDKLLELCKRIEGKRNDLAYGSPIEDEEEIKKLIDDFWR